MRTNIDIDDDLLKRAMRDSGAKTKKAAVEEGLKILIQAKAQASILKLRGKVKFFDDVERSRLERSRERKDRGE
jgi:Arc/MetJ family transcription regulator